jgi:hypothetical protein
MSSEINMVNCDVIIVERCVNYFQRFIC